MAKITIIQEGYGVVVLRGAVTASVALAVERSLGDQIAGDVTIDPAGEEGKMRLRSYIYSSNQLAGKILVVLAAAEAKATG